METIRNYLESMFRGLPQTEKIMRAKSELLQMMEDKYTELIRSGKTENEAVGEVIQNFGNLDDLADDLGIQDVLHQSKYSEVNRRKIPFEDITEYLAAKRKAILIRAAGIFLCIICVCFPILTKAFDLPKVLGPVFMFISIGLGVMCITLGNSTLDEWRYINKVPCTIDAVSIDYLKNKIRDFTPTYSVLSSVGVLLCILCFVPCIVFGEIGGSSMGEIGASFLFIFVGAGVFMMVYAKSMKRAYHRLLNINDNVDFEEETNTNSIENIPNTTVRVLMSVYWSVITCIYLSISFLTFKWHMTWLIWPIAAAVNSIIKAIYSIDDSKKRD